MRLGLIRGAIGGAARGHQVTAAAAASILLLTSQHCSGVHAFQPPSSNATPHHCRARSLHSMSSNGNGAVRLPSPLMFGPYKIDEEQVFFSSRLTMAIVNLKPIVPGHILVVPHRIAVRFQDLRPDEVADLYLSVHEIAPKLEQHYGGHALTISIQDGAAAGQTVPHVHVHVLPRKPGDFEPNDKVYEELEAVHLKKHFDLDADRRPRILEEMAAEAAELRELFPERQWERQQG